MLKPVLTFYVNTEEPEGDRHIGVVISSPTRDKLVGGVISDSKLGGDFLVSVSAFVMGLASDGLIPDNPLPGWEALPGVTRDEEAA